ncbi:GNAT family N-acetyltransferase [Paenisporosarcina sp. OV554]|uniref:GNAT family N-acetyltransferase n=1 Tax=Paenisporosarcina sp. OV554 TaxID=2135694 RepID=UPI000D4DA2AF|nr:GNAT family N-acetyltransferase [Paenisporosarcina sp. OV554]PUB11980.1 RimJ/RimL family protein N-acetyltransferase [Paenisporosarcina sp. OV554]
MTFTKETDAINVGSSSIPDNILIIRPVDLNDAHAIIHLQQDIDTESDFMLFGKDAQKMSIQFIRKRIGEWKKSENTRMFVGILNGEFVGFVALVTLPSPQASHRATIEIGVHRSYYKKSVWTSLMSKAEAWAQEVGISRLELTVVENNVPVLDLYKKLGYSVEGTRSNSLLINEEYINELYMGKNVY